MDRLDINNLNYSNLYICRIEDDLKEYILLSESNCRPLSKHILNGELAAEVNKVRALFDIQKLETAYTYSSGFGTVILGTAITAFAVFKLYKKVTALPKSLQDSDQNQLLEKLKKAEVITGQWKGRYLNLEGIGLVTFSQVSRRIEQLYNHSVKFMLDKHHDYENDKKVHWWELIFPPAFVLMYLVRGLIIPPKINKNEEKIVCDAMSFRNESFKQLSDHFEKSQIQLNQNSTTFSKQWDRILDKISSWRSVSNEKDIKILESMNKG